MEQAAGISAPVQSQTPEQLNQEMSNNMPRHQTPETPSADMEVDQPVEDDAMRKIGADSRELIGFIQKLEALSIKSALPSLPKFVVVGDQSAGKSSIIEALCDIKLPRGEGTCTRCPFKITTTSSKANRWVCKVSVHQKYRYDKTARARGQNSYKYWIEDDEISISEIATIYDKESLELELRRAQVAILNPERLPSDFVNIDMTAYLASDDMPTDELVTVAFSPNWVALEIASPNLPELSLYDLPGAINVHPDDDQQYLAKFVEDLIKSYVKEEKTLVLLACPMNVDIDNTTAFKYMRQCNALGRSMGVRTKPDTVTINKKRLEKEIPLLKGEKWKLGGGGWYITKQCSQEEIEEGNVTYADARRMEQDFFSQAIWTQVLGEFSDRLGTASLQTALSERLTTHIRNDIPTIEDRIRSRRSQVEHELTKFPSPEENPLMAIMNELSQLKTCVAEHMSIEALGSEQFSNKFRELFKSLVKDLRESAPQLTVVTPGWVPMIVEVDSSDDTDKPSPSKKVKTATGRATNTTPSRPPRPSKQRSSPNPKAHPSTLSPQPPNRLTLNLKELGRRLDSAPGANLPGQIDERVIRQLIRESLQSWPAAVDKLFQGMTTLFREAMAGSLKSIDARRGTAFHDVVKECVTSFLAEVLEHQKIHLQDAVSCELHIPFTISKSFGPEKATQDLEYQGRRNAQRVREHFDAKQTKRAGELDQEKFAKDVKWIAENLGADKYEREINGFARVIAYYNMASSQFVDQLAKNTHFHMLSSFDSHLFERIFKELDINNISHCAQLLVADPLQRRQRQALVTELEKITAALNELQSL